jgi:hypothetical protein
VDAFAVESDTQSVGHLAAVEAAIARGAGRHSVAPDPLTRKWYRAHSHGSQVRTI